MPLINEKITFALCLILSLVHAPLLQAAEDTSASIVKFQQTMATKGHATAQYKLAMLYETGDGVEKSLDTARIWYGRAASQAYTPATHRLQYLNISTGTRADQTWLKQLHRDAQSGEGEAMFLLGQMYARGTGVTQELTLASRYLRQARGQNIPGSEAELAQVDIAIQQQQAEALATEKQQAAAAAKQAQQKADAKLAEQQRRQQIQQQKKLSAAQHSRQQQTTVSKQTRPAAAKPVTPAVTQELVNREAALPPIPAGAVTEMDLSPCSGRYRFTSTCR